MTGFESASQFHDTVSPPTSGPFTTPGLTASAPSPGSAASHVAPITGGSAGGAPSSITSAGDGLTNPHS